MRIAYCPFFHWFCHVVAHFSLCFSVGADQNLKNDKGETPYDLAAKGGYESLVKKFAAALGQSQLQKMIKPKNKGY